MRVFVTGTGRCGSVSFREACRFAANYTTGHETLCGLLEYPDQHIEVNPQFRKCIKALVDKYPDARFVHLVRPAEDCIPSLAALNHGEVMQCYTRLHPSIMPSGSLEEVAWRFYHCENDIIRAQLLAYCEPNRWREMHLEKIQTEWPSFWRWIAASGDYKASLASWDVPRNTRQERGED